MKNLVTTSISLKRLLVGAILVMGVSYLLQNGVERKGPDVNGVEWNGSEWSSKAVQARYTFNENRIG